MTATDILNTLQKWADASLCDIELKEPDDAAAGNGYKYKLVRPRVFWLFVPTPEKMTQADGKPVPCLCILLNPPEMKNGIATAAVNVRLSTWDPGNHAGDFLTGKGYLKVGDLKTQIFDGDDEDKKFKYDAEGWRGLYHWIDKITAEIKKNPFIDGKIRIKIEDGVRSGAYGMDGNGQILDFYPYFHGFIDFSIEYGYNTGSREFDNLL